MDTMATYMAAQLIKRESKQGLVAAQQMYRGYFISTQLYLAYKEDVDSILTIEGHEDIIVTA